MTVETAAKLRNLLVPIRELIDEGLSSKGTPVVEQFIDAHAALIEILELADIDGVAL